MKRAAHPGRKDLKKFEGKREAQENCEDFSVLRGVFGMPVGKAHFRRMRNHWLTGVVMRFMSSWKTLHKSENKHDMFSIPGKDKNVVGAPGDLFSLRLHIWEPTHTLQNIKNVRKK